MPLPIGLKGLGRRYRNRTRDKWFGGTCDTISLISYGQKAEIRTPDLYVPNVALYLAEPLPDVGLTD